MIGRAGPDLGAERNVILAEPDHQDRHLTARLVWFPVRESELQATDLRCDDRPVGSLESYRVANLEVFVILWNNPRDENQPAAPD